MELSERQILLIHTLADGHCHSGEALGQLLGISRAAVWKQLQPLQDLGLEILSRKGRGYYLPQPIALLNTDIIAGLLSPQVQPLLRAMVGFNSIDSTNAWLLREANRRPIGGVLVMAEQQTAGRGRRGRTWVSPFGCNLYFSLGWQFEQGVAALEGLSLAIGVAIVEALQALGVKGLALKWPNDILLEGRKLGGILLEVGGDLSGQCYVVVGVGLNLTMSPHQAADVGQPWASLHEQLQAMCRNSLAAQLFNHIVPLLATFAQEGFGRYKTRWEQLNAYRHQVISIQREGASIEGICRDLTATGALCVDTAAGEIQLQGGEISVRVNP